jgi:hypothetical protein
VAGLGIGDGLAHRLLVADLADEDHVRRLAQRILQRGLERQGIRTDFALIDDRLLVTKEKFDRVFQRQDVAGAVGVAVVQQRGQCRRFTRAGGADDQHQATLFHDHFLQHFGQAQGVEGWNVDRNVTHHHRRRATLIEAGNPIHADLRQTGAHIQFARLGQLIDLRFAQHLAQQIHHRRFVDDGGIHRHGIAVDLDGDRRAAGEEQIGSLLVGHQLKQPVHVAHRVLPVC